MLTRVTLSYVGGQNCQKGPKMMIFAIFEHFWASKLPRKGHFLQKLLYGLFHLVLKRTPPWQPRGIAKYFLSKKLFEEYFKKSPPKQ